MANLFAENDLHLTTINPALESARAKTVAGMAHFAGSGPDNKTCRECLHWTGCGHGDGYSARKGMGGGLIRSRACDKFRLLMNNVVGGKVPPLTPACKYFEENPKPPALYA